MTTNTTNITNITNCAEEEIIVVKTKKITKTRPRPRPRPKVEFVFEEEKGAFIDQVFRKDILANLLSNANLTGKELFDLIITEKKLSHDERRQGWVFESLCQILIVLKCVENIHYTEIFGGQLQNLKQLKNVNALLKVKVDGGGNNIVDIAIKQHQTLVLFTIKYRNKYSETDVSKIDNTVTKQSITDDYKIGLIVKDKAVVIKHKYKNELNIDKQIHGKIIENGLLFDETDVINALDVFCQRFHNNTLSVDDFIDVINAEYLLSPRQQLRTKLHQKMSELKFIKFLKMNKYFMWCIEHKPRSGKSITILLICKYLLENGYKKILIMTSVPATINSFIEALDMYIDFKAINYKSQDEFDTIDASFHGIVFCSVQYLKMDGKTKNTKKEFLKRMGFDVTISDEAHQGSSTDKTRADILEVDSDIEDICKNTKLNIFASGTADKTKKYYRIHSSCVDEWEIVDEAFMKRLIKPTTATQKEEIIKYMVNRHGPAFIECFENETLNKDYSKHPTQVLMKYSIPQSLIDEINAYNAKYGTKFGYSCSSLLALRQTTNDKGEVEYAEEFELCKTTDGLDILKGFLDYIISSNRMRMSTIMKEIEMTQTNRGSRKSTVDNPLMFIIYLPTHTRNNTISLLQKTFKQFLETHHLWGDYNIEYSNSNDNSNNINEKEYNKEIEDYMRKTKVENKKGCILLLGNKGSVGITYNECDVTISLDDGHNLDNQKQRFSRALTEAKGKTIGINIDMNIQRTYLCVIDMIQKHRKNTKTTKTNAEILYYLFEHNIFLFNPHLIHYGKLTTFEILSYYQREVEHIMKEIDDTPFLENIICDDEMREFIKTNFQNIKRKETNKDLEGAQQDCPKGDTTKNQIDAPLSTDSASQPNDNEDSTITEEESQKVELLINQTYEMCKSFLFPLLALISRSYKIFNFNEIFTNEKTKNLIISLLKDKKIELNESNYIIILSIMNQIIENNGEIVNNIREIYSTAPAHKLRELIAKHFIPTQEEKKSFAEIPTPVKLVDDMLNSVPPEFWQTPQKVFEPCCGKGNFVLGMVSKFNDGLRDKYPDNEERIRIIMTECIYYADINALNVFITTELLRCEFESICGINDIDFDFNGYIGNTLELNIQAKWNLRLEDVATIGNPPYSTDPSKQDTKPLYDKFIERYINSKMLLFVVPSRWFIGGKGLDHFRDFMMKRTDIVFIKHEDNAKSWFGNHVEIKGGVNYFLKDASYNGTCLFNGVPYNLSKYDCIVKPTYHEMIDTVSSLDSIAKIYCSSGYFKYRTNDSRLGDVGEIKCYVSSLKSKDRSKYIDDYDFTENNTFWKVITPRAAFGAFSGFGEKFIGKPNEIHTDSYISFRVNNEQEARSLLSYLDTKFANHLLSIRKISQDISENTCKWIPLVPLDRIWSDDKVCEFLKIIQPMYI